MVDKKILIIAAIVVVVVIVASIVVLALALGIGLGVGLNDSSSDSNSSAPPSSTYAGGLSAVCPGASGTPSNPPVQVSFLRNVQAGETSWFASPIVADLDNDGVNELVAAYYSLFVYDNNYVLLDKADTSGPRVFPPHIVANIDNSGPVEVCIGQGENVICYNLVNKKLVAKWTSTSIGTDFEIRGMACADLTGGGGSKQIVVTTTRTDGTSIFVFDGATGNAYSGWPRYNTGSDTTVNGFGNSGYGEYGVNVGIGNINSDSNLEIITTFDNHQIQAFRADGTSINASSYYTYPWSGPYFGNRMTWGQFIRWYNADDEAGLYNTHTSTPVVENNPWMQWTQSPPSVADLDLDGQSEVLGVSNIETAPNGPYVTQYWALAVFNGDYGDIGATRKSGWEVFPRGGSPVKVNGDYPPTGIPAPAIANILGDSKLEIIVTLNDGNIYCFDYNGTRLWNYNFKNGLNIIYSTEPAIADLNNDGSPEIIFATFGAPGVDSGYLIILSADGNLKNSIKIDTQGNNNGNGNGIPAPPTVADLDGDGTLEIFLQSFEHGMDVYHVSNSTTNCVFWGTSRGNYERTGAPS